MLVIVAGGTGLIGRALVESLISGGHEVVVLSRHPEKAGNLPGRAHFERWDGQTLSGWEKLLDGAAAIVNLAGESIAAGRWTARRKEAILATRINAGKAIAQAIELAHRKPRVLVQSSAVGYYGPRGNEPVFEDTPPGTDFLARVCVEWEASSRQVEQTGTRRVIIRTGVVLSTRGGAFPRLLLPFRLHLGGWLGDGGQWLPWIHISDEVEAIRFLIENETLDGPFNLSAPHPVTNADFARAIGDALRQPARLHVPAPALRLVFGEMATSLLSSQRVLPRRLTGSGFEFGFPDIGSALRDLLQ